MNANSMKMTSYLFLGALAVLYVSFINEALSATAPNLRCQTPNEEKTFTVSEHKVTFHHENAFDRNRAISSEVSAHTQKTYTGFTKVLYIQGSKHKIHIEDLSKMSDVDDFITIISPKGHTMTYPINCQLI